jgi:hypothetical protein
VLVWTGWTGGLWGGEFAFVFFDRLLYLRVILVINLFYDFLCGEEM